VVVSWLTCREDFNMERMLHRGAYALEPAGATPPPARPRSWLTEFIGIDEHFTRGDRILAWSVVLWSMFWFVLFVVITGWNLIARWPLQWWATYWYYEMIFLPIIVMALTTVWFWWGGVRDLVRLFQRLHTLKRNELDDGRVVGHRNVGEGLEARGTGG
jgi:solute:Na+ symporter, SSS family